MDARMAKIESDVGKIQVDVRDLRTEMKAANESIADLKVDVARLNGKIDTSTERLDGKIDALSKEVDTRFNALNAKVDANHLAMRAGFLETNKSISDLQGSIASLRESIGDLKGSQRIFLWALGAGGALGVIGKIFHWF